MLFNKKIPETKKKEKEKKRERKYALRVVGSSVALWFITLFSPVKAKKNE